MARRRRGSEHVHGWLALDKPVGVTSNKALGAVRTIFGVRKAGHAGTLDPLASGILPIAFGEATKTVPYAVEGRKVYRFTVRWGAETDTDDAEGEIIQTSDNRPEHGDIEAILPNYIGEIEQVPPRYSAIKIAGERAYDLAREGADFELASRLISIDALRMIERPDADTAVFEAGCGKGTYVRALARDFGRELGCFGHVSALRRTRVGPFDEAAMISLDKLEELRHIGAGQRELADLLQPVETALDDIPAVAITGSDAARLRRGQAILLRGRDAPVFQGTVYATERGCLVAVAEVSQGQMHPKRVFNLSGA